MYQSRTKSPEIIIPMWRDARSPPQNLRGCRKERERFGTLPHNWVQTASLSSRKQYISCQKPKKTSRIPFFSLLLISFQPSSIRDPWLSKCNPYIADPQSSHSTKCCGSINYNIKLGMEWNGVMMWWWYLGSFAEAGHPRVMVIAEAMGARPKSPSVAKQKGATVSAIIVQGMWWRNSDDRPRGYASAATAGRTRGWRGAATIIAAIASTSTFSQGASHRHNTMKSAKIWETPYNWHLDDTIITHSDALLWPWS